MSARLRSQCSPPCVTGTSGDEQKRNYLCTVILFSTASLGWLMLMFYGYSTLLQVQQDLTEFKYYLNSEKQNLLEINEMLAKLGVIISRLRKEIKEEMKVVLEKGVALSQDSYKKIKILMQSQLEFYDSDKTGLTDYALELAGGKILSTRNTETYSPGAPVLSIFGVPLCTQTNKAKAILQTSVMPGECWAVKGQQASAVIQLIAKVYVTNVSLEHLPKSLSPTGEIDSAPKEFSIWGLTDEDGNSDSHFFGQFVYDKDGPPLQTFQVQNPDTRTFKIIEFKLHSNHGNTEYTCIYRVRIHGKMQGSFRQNHPAI